MNRLICLKYRKNVNIEIELSNYLVLFLILINLSNFTNINRTRYNKIHTLELGG